MELNKIFRNRYIKANVACGKTGIFPQRAYSINDVKIFDNHSEKYIISLPHIIHQN